MIVAASDRPEVREFVRYLLGPDFGRALAFSAPGFIAARSDFDIENYTTWDGPNLLIRPMAASVQQALANDAFRFDGSDLMPPEVGQFPFYGVMVEYIAEGPDNLDELLQRLDDAWPDD
jgi:alpha-glucoside transport system substrate-binding protein